MATLYEVGNEIVLTVGRGKKKQLLRVVAVTEKDAAGRWRTRRTKRRPTKRT